MIVFYSLFVALFAFSYGMTDDESLRLSRVKRLFKASERIRWTHGIVPYTFDDTLRVLAEDKRKDYQEKVFPLFEKYSCIKFVPWTPNTTTQYQLDHNNYLIFEENKQCSSQVGNTRRNGQRITCCGWRTCLHEIGHAIGMLHEHTSPIRDDFVRINAEHIESGLYSAFDKETDNVETYGTYDYDSIMHYGLKSWSSDGNQTISFLDPDTKPASQFADKEQYFYFFKQINEAYNCTDKCTDLSCYNGGYKALVQGKCRCRCPEGLNPATQCTSLLDLPNKDTSCGEILSLDDQTPTAMFQSPTFRGNQTTTCYWYIKSPPNTRILLNFPQFNIRKKKGVCKDEVAVKPYLPGMYGIPYCGGVFKKTVQSAGNMLAFAFTQTPSDSTISVFTAHVSFVHEESYCYNLDNSGLDYSSAISFTDDSTRCLHWDMVTNCKHHLFNIQDIDKRLERNYCRNPDNSTGPWCYTNTDGCVRKFCDACNLGVCKDFDGKCTQKINNQPAYCSTNNQAPSQCRKSCGFCDSHEPLPSVTETFCDAPLLPPDAVPISLKDTYSVGETIKVECNQGTEYQHITCLSDGRWTELTYVCGTCLPGWVDYRRGCYKMFNNNMKQAEAESFCNSQQPEAELIVDAKWNHDFVTELVKNEQGQCTPVWIGLTRSTDSNIFTWKSGAEPYWTNWAGETEPGSLGCVAINSRCDWVTKWCKSKMKFVCRYYRSVPVICADQRSDCNIIKRRNPDFCNDQQTFALTYCAKSCDRC